MIPLQKKMSLDTLVHKLSVLYHSQETRADTLGKVTYSLVIGAGLDYFAAGLRGWGLVTSRASATALNIVTGRPYGKWREGWYRLTRTREESSPFRKGLVELGALNTFETYVYGAGVCLGSLVQAGEIDFDKAREGMIGLMVWSPLIAPTLGWWMDGTRKLFGVEKAAAKATGY